MTLFLDILNIELVLLRTHLPKLGIGHRFQTHKPAVMSVYGKARSLDRPRFIELRDPVAKLLPYQDAQPQQYLVYLVHSAKISIKFILRVIKCAFSV